MTLSELIRTRRTVNTYTNAPVDEAVVNEALALSLWAPNHRHTHPWKYALLGTQTRAQLGELAAELKGGGASIKGQAARASVTTSAHLLALATTRATEPMVAHEDYATLSCSVQILSLVLWERGIATKWSTAGWTMHPRTYELFGWNPDELKLEGCLMIGVPERIPPAPPRPDLSTVLQRLP